MANPRDLARLFVGSISVACVASSVIAILAQTRSPLTGLTVPSSRLPAGCHLEPLGKTGEGQPKLVMFPGTFDANPWIGDSPGIVGSIRTVVEGSMATRSAEHIAEAYRARYVTFRQQLVSELEMPQ